MSKTSILRFQVFTIHKFIVLMNFNEFYCDLRVVNVLDMEVGLHPSGVV